MKEARLKRACRMHERDEKRLQNFRPETSRDETTSETSA
jgi:hypothetical protein